MKKIFTVACEIPGGIGEYVHFDSKTSLLDADFVLFYPKLCYEDIMDSDFNFDSYLSQYSHFINDPRLFQGRPSLSDRVSFQLRAAVDHWLRELTDFLNTGRTVFMIMSRLEQVYVNTGEEEHSGTNRNRKSTKLVRLLSNYDVLPPSAKIVESEGTSMNLKPGEPLLKEYWQQFGNESKYLVHIETSDSFKPLVITSSGNRTVAAISRSEGGGTLVTP